MIGQIIKGKAKKSLYQPSQDVIDITKTVKEDYTEGIRLITEPWVELNDRSVIEDTNRGQLIFNAFVDESIQDPHEAWKWRGTVSKARNKGIAMHAQLTAGFLLPLFIAQNENDEVDKDFSEIMRYVIEWMVQPSVSNYQSSYLQLVFSMEQNPVTFMGAEFIEVMQTIKERTADGKVSKKEIVDEVLSGFKVPLYGPTEVLITNAYERNIQKQRAIIPRKFKDKSALKAQYGHHKNWGHIEYLLENGLKSVYNAEDGLFYDIKDDDRKGIGAEEIWKNRHEDMEIPFLQGIYVGDDEVENNPIKHRDNLGAPKYNVVPFGFHRIGDHFFYFKSMMNSLSWVNQLTDEMVEQTVNRGKLDIDAPIVATGGGKIDSQVVFPKAIISTDNPDFQAKPLLPPSRIDTGFSIIKDLADPAADEGSVSSTLQGQLPKASQKAYSVAQARADAKRLIGAVGKALSESIIQFGDLMKDIAINHYSVPQVEELTAGQSKLKYKTLFLENRESAGKVTNKKIKFDANLIGLELTDKEKKIRGLRLLEKAKKEDKNISLYLVNPELFARFRYLVKVDTDEIFNKNQEYWQQVLPQLKATLAQDPFVNQEALTRKLMYAFFQSEGEDMMKDDAMALGIPQQTPKLSQPQAQPALAGNQII